MIQRVLAIGGSQSTRTGHHWLTDAEAGALLAAPDRATWIGRRDHAMLLTALRTGLRVSELTRLTCNDVRLGAGAHLHCQGKGASSAHAADHPTVKVLALAQRTRRRADPLFPARRGGPLCRDAVERLNHNQTTAATGCPSLRTKRVPRPRPASHQRDDAPAIRHRHQRHRAVARARGQHDPRLPPRRPRLKQRALDRTTPPGPVPAATGPDQLLAYLESL